MVKRIVFLFSIVLMFCSCKSFESTDEEKVVGTYKNGYVLNSNKEIVATYRNGYFMMQGLMNSNLFTDYFFLSPNLTFGKNKLLLATQFCNYKFDVNKRRYLFFSDAGEERQSRNWYAWKPAREMVYHYLDAQQLPNNIVWKRKSYLGYNHLTSFPMALHDAYQGYFDYIDSIKSLAASDTTTLSRQVYRKHIEIVVKDANQEVYISGNQKSLGIWNPGLIKLQHVNDSIRAIDIDLHLPALFKFTLGNWKYDACFENSFYGDNLEINNTERKNYSYVLTEWMNIENN